MVFTSALWAAEGDADIQWLQDVDVTLQHNDNIGQAAISEDEVSSAVAFASYSLIADRELEGDCAISARAFVELQQVNDVSELGSSSLGLQLSYRWQPTLGYLAPFYQVNASVQRNHFGASQRHSTVARAQFIATRRLTDALTLAAGIEHFQQQASNATFDLDHNRAFLNLDYRASGTTNLYATYSFRQGDITSTAQSVLCDGSRSGDIDPLVAEYESRTADQAFNSEFCGSWTSYRLDADTHVLTFGANRSIGLRSAIDLSVRRVDARASAGIRYASNIISASYLVRF